MLGCLSAACTLVAALAVATIPNIANGMTLVACTVLAVKLFLMFCSVCTVSKILS
jgi:hypothetical protein